MGNTLTFTPTGTVYHVRLCRGPEQSSGGVWLPETYQDNFTEAEVLFAGPGMRIAAPDGVEFRSIMWAQSGERVLFQKNAFAPFGREEREGTVRDEDLVAVVREMFTDYWSKDPDQVTEETIEPLNDWVRVRPAAPKRVSDIIDLPDFYQRAPRCGVVEDMGPGRLRLTGKLAGVRVPVFRELGLQNRYQLLHKIAYWGENAAVLDVGGEVLECILVRAGDLLALEEVEDGSSQAA